MITAGTMIRNLQRAGIRPACCVFMVIALAQPWCSPVWGQTLPGTDSTAMKDSAFLQRDIHVDSTRVPWRLLGAVTRNANERSVDLTKKDRREYQYQSMADLLIRSTPYQRLSHGGMGQHSTLSIFGGYDRDIVVSTNGRSLYDPWSGSYHLMQSAPERAERVEVLTGIYAVGLAPSMTVSAVNIQDVVHSTPRPFTSLWYAQGGGDVIAADVELSQDVAPGLNATIGIRRSGGRGRYQQTDFDVWNASALFRYTVTEKDHLQLSYSLASVNTDLWGGVRTTQPLSLYREETTPTVFSGLRDETRRHDLTATYVRFLNSDTTRTITVQAFTSITSLRRFRDNSLFLSPQDSLGTQVTRGGYGGALIRTDHQWTNVHLRLGASIDYRDVAASVYTDSLSIIEPQVFGLATLSLSSTLRLLGAARIQHGLNAPRWAGGIGLELRPTPHSLIRADLSRIERLPSPADGIGRDSEKHMLALLTYSSHSDDFNINLQAFYRRIELPLVTRTDRTSSQTIRSTLTFNAEHPRIVYGGMASLRWEGSWLEVQPVVRWHGGNTSEFPVVSAEVSAAFVYHAGPSYAKLGLRGMVMTTASFRQFVPLTWTYTDPVTPQSMVGNGLDVFLTAHLGNADVRVSYENVLLSRWYTASVMPEIVQDLRLSVTWSFLD